MGDAHFWSLQYVMTQNFWVGGTPSANNSLSGGHSPLLEWQTELWGWWRGELGFGSSCPPPHPVHSSPHFYDEALVLTGGGRGGMFIHACLLMAHFWSPGSWHEGVSTELIKNVTVKLGIGGARL